ncbi:hypothetical protein WR25_12913 [Diploscapter pachys]|uniref:Uncharacterized protein n=1 Tax=Diploscapter pachys TaxID=2018661 RepID=A0A2A2K4W9_9BILA|nr:hypothetical protein WR25_12913 [Diploscapter pachys]
MTLTVLLDCASICCAVALSGRSARTAAGPRTRFIFPLPLQELGGRPRHPECGRSVDVPAERAEAEGGGTCRPGHRPVGRGEVELVGVGRVERADQFEVRGALAEVHDLHVERRRTAGQTAVQARIEAGGGDGAVVRRIDVRGDRRSGRTDPTDDGIARPGRQAADVHRAAEAAARRCRDVAGDIDAERLIVRPAHRRGIDGAVGEAADTDADAGAAGHRARCLRCGGHGDRECKNRQRTVDSFLHGKCSC